MEAIEKVLRKYDLPRNLNREQIQAITEIVENKQDVCVQLPTESL